MAIKGKDKEFRCLKVTYLEYKPVEMERALTMLFPRLKYNGSNSRFKRVQQLEIDTFLEEFIGHPEWFKGFKEHRHIAYKWLETDLLDLVNRGKNNQAVAAPRPLHGNTYKFRNRKYVRDYGSSEEIYWMLYHARKGKGQAARDALKNFFFKGYDFVTDKYEDTNETDVETQAILRLDHQVTQDARDSKQPEVNPPLCIGSADVMADDILRLLSYEDHIPRSVMVDYLKTLLAFHLALTQLKLFLMLPTLVKNQGHFGCCSTQGCTVDPSGGACMQECPYKISMIVEMGDKNNEHMVELARQSAERFYRQIPTYIQANYTVRKLEELGDYLKTTKKLDAGNGHLTLDTILSLLGPEHESERAPYFKHRLANLVEEGTSGDDDLDPEIENVLDMQLNDFDSFIEIVMAYRGKYHRDFITKCIDSLLLKNKESGLLAQTRTTGSPRRFVMGSKLLEVLLQLAVLSPEGGRFTTREIRVEELLDFLRQRYGIFIDQLPADEQAHSSILDRRALRLNAEAFKKRLREIGFYSDLSDAYVTQKITPRYTIKPESQTP
jgi:hypothetical protein